MFYIKYIILCGSEIHTTHTKLNKVHKLYELSVFFSSHNFKDLVEFSGCS